MGTSPDLNYSHSQGHSKHRPLGCNLTITASLSGQEPDNTLHILWLTGERLIVAHTRTETDRIYCQNK